MSQNFDTNVALSAGIETNGQPVDFDGASASSLTITNNSGISIQYSADGAVTWTTLANGSSASPTVPDATTFFLRKQAPSGIPVFVKLSWRARDSFDPSSVAITGRSAPASLVVWGDSTAAMCAPTVVSGTSYRNLGNNWVQVGLAIAGHPLEVVAVSGHSGFRTDQVLPLFAADVQAYAPSYVLLSVGTNDITQGVAAATAVANVAAMAAACLSISAIPILMTISCGETISASSVNRQTWLEYNQRIRALAQSMKLRLVDVETVYIDTTSATAAPLSGYTDGTVHPGNKGSIKWGQALANALVGMPPRYLRTLAPGVMNGASNPFFTGTGGTLNGATGSAPNNTIVSKSAGSTVTSSIVARTDGTAGSWWQCQFSNATGSDFFNMYLGSAITLAGSQFSVGDTIRAMVDVQVDTGFTNFLAANLRLAFTGSSGITTVEAYAPATALGGITDPCPQMLQRTPDIAIPAGTTSIQPILVMGAITAAAHAATVRAAGLSISKVF